MDSAEWIQNHLKNLRRLHGSWKVGSRTTKNSLDMLQWHNLDVHWASQEKYEMEGGEYHYP